MLRFDNVSFAYPSAPDTPVLRNVSFTRAPGRDHRHRRPARQRQDHHRPPDPALLRRDRRRDHHRRPGHPRRDARLAAQGGGGGEQDVFLFTTTIENNIAYGDPWAEEAAIEGSSGDAQLHDYIDTLPERYRTVVGERGVSLSGGQRQRLSIARTLMLPPAILVFDDSTAAIDARTEERIPRRSAQAASGGSRSSSRTA